MKDWQIREAIQVARKNWNDWQDVFEHRGAVRDNPLLACSTRFATFLQEYSVYRTIRNGTHDELRRKLRRSQQFLKVIHDNTGHTFDRFEDRLRKTFGNDGRADGDRKHIVSALSKVAAFVRPQRFVAWDRFAKRGVNVALGRAPSFPFKGYADYLAAFEEAWEGRAGHAIKDYVKRKGTRTKVEKHARFQRRVLDVYLMKRGGRWPARRTQPAREAGPSTCLTADAARPRSG